MANVNRWTRLGLLIALLAGGAWLAARSAPAQAGAEGDRPAQAQQYEKAKGCPKSNALFQHRGGQGPGAEYRLKTYRGCIDAAADCEFIAGILNAAPSEQMSLWFCR